MKKIEYILKHNKFVQKVYVILFSTIFRILGIFIKRDKKQILFQSLIGRTYGDSPKALFDAIKKDEHFKEYKFVWAFEHPEKFIVDGAKVVKLTSLNYYIEALRSGIWISNVSIERGLKFKPNGTISLNTWHGTPLKLIGNAQKTRNDYDYSSEDFVCCSSDFEKEIFIRDFNIRPETIHKCGMPRNDELFHPDSKINERVRNILGIPKDKKIILYAPTWRDSIDGGASYQITPPMNLEYWKKELGDKYVMLFRMHHLTTQMMGIKFDDFAIDVSNYPQINDLMIISDILLSDYSATIFDYSILEKPIISFAYDLEEYSAKRGLYEDIEKDVLPGSVFKSEQEVLNHIKNMNYDEEINKSRKIKMKYANVTGNATEVCMNFLKNKTVGYN